MHLRRVCFVSVAIVLLGAALACGGEVSVSTARVSDAYMSADEGGDQPTDAYAQDSVFYSQVDLQNAPEDTALRAVWTVVDAQDTDPGLVINETEYETGSGRVYFTLSNDDLWPIGTYRVEIYLNGELATSLDFSVQ